MKYCFIVFVFIFSISVKAQSLYIPAEPIKLDFLQLERTKKALLQGDTSLLPSYQALLLRANNILKISPKTVMDKLDAPMSGNKHDYISLAPYWWPDSSKKNGLPYIKKDGLINPEVKLFQDKENMPKLCEQVYLLGLAYFFSKDEKYAAKATQLLYAWFLDTATLMNPHLNYAQMVKGINNGRGTGIIDTRHFIYALDGVKLIQSSSSWTWEYNNSLKSWFGSFLNWMLQSDNGKDEFQTKNNHGVWFDAQSLSIALFVDSLPLAKKIIDNALERLDQQSNNEGLFPLELERTNSLHYSCFNLLAFSVIAQLASDINVDFWHTTTKNNHSLQKAYEALVPYLTYQKQWQYPQISEFRSEESWVLLYLANKQWKNKNSSAYIHQQGFQYKTMLMHLL